MSFFRKALLPVFAILPFASMAQVSDSASVKTYGELGLGFGTHTSFKVAVGGIFMKNNILNLTFSMAVKDGDYVPYNYSGWGILGDGIPNTRIFFAGILYGKMLYTRRDIVRIGLKGGLGYARISEPRNFIRHRVVFGEPNYTYGRQVVQTVGVMLNPSIEFPVSENFGVCFSGISMLIPYHVTCGAELTFVFR